MRNILEKVADEVKKIKINNYFLIVLL